MTTDTAAVTAERAAMVHRLFDVIDRRDIDALADAFEPDGVQQLGNHSPIRGREAIRAGNAALMSLAGLRHEITGLWESGATVIVRALVHYALQDGRTVTLPAVTIFSEGANGLIDHYQVFYDITPLFAPQPHPIGGRG